MILQLVFLSLALATGDEPDSEKHESNRNTESLIRWSNPESLVGGEIKLSVQGVSIRIVGEVIPAKIPWFDVRSFSAVYAQYEQQALDAWRAHARLSRGDFAGAESIYRSLESQYLYTIGSQGADVSYGLVRCRLDRDERVLAVGPFLSWLGSERGGNTYSGQRSSARAFVGFDPAYDLFIDLPPIFGPADHGRILEPIPGSSGVFDRQRAIFGLYELALDDQIHRTPLAEYSIDQIRAVIRNIETRDPGLDLINDMVIAQSHPDFEKRSAARKSLERRIRTNQATWIELWCRLAIGVSLINESETESNELGVIELIHIIVRLEHISPSLAGLAAEIANEYLSNTDRPQWGSILMFRAASGSIVAQSDRYTKEQIAHD